MSFAELLAEVKNLSPSEKDALRSFLAGDLLKEEESEEFLAQLVQMLLPMPKTRPTRLKKLVKW